MDIISRIADAINTHALLPPSKQVWPYCPVHANVHIATFDPKPVRDPAAFTRDFIVWHRAKYPPGEWKWIDLWILAIEFAIQTGREPLLEKDFNIFGQVLGESCLRGQRRLADKPGEKTRRHRTYDLRKPPAIRKRVAPSP
jgi:hypothetical protein